jgi:hypothetical protein
MGPNLSVSPNKFSAELACIKQKTTKMVNTCRSIVTHYRHTHVGRKVRVAGSHWKGAIISHMVRLCVCVWPFQSGPEVYKRVVQRKNLVKAKCKPILILVGRVTCADWAVAWQRDSTHYFWLEIFGTKRGGGPSHTHHERNGNSKNHHHYELLPIGQKYEKNMWILYSAGHASCFSLANNKQNSRNQVKSGGVAKATRFLLSWKKEESF